MSKTVFTENLEDNQLVAVRTFNAPIEKVWRAWSEPDLLCQWWAPQPYTCTIYKMDFQVGGSMLYNMIGPEGDEYRGRMDYLKIEKHAMYEVEDYFCDEEGNKTDDVPPMLLNVTFKSDGTTTTVTSTTTFASPEAFKQMAEMGAVEGWDLAYNQLEELLDKAS